MKVRELENDSVFESNDVVYTNGCSNGATPLDNGMTHTQAKEHGFLDNPHGNRDAWAWDKATDCYWNVEILKDGEEIMNGIDWTAVAMDSKSHETEELEKALLNGDKIWLFDSGSSGNDDILIGDRNETEDDIKAGLEDFFEVGEDFGEPSPWEPGKADIWTLTEFTGKDLANRYPLGD